MIKYLIGVIFIVSLISCEVINTALQTVDGSNNSSKPGLTNDEVISGLKEALNVGIKNSVSLTSITDGFLKNDAIRIVFPQDAIKIKEKAIEFGMSGQVEKFETTLNRAAEEATKEA